MRFPRQQFDAIVREKEGDRAVPVTLLPDKIQELIKQEKKLNTMYWSFWEKGKVTDVLLSNYFMHERNAVRVRITRMQKRLLDG